MSIFLSREAPLVPMLCVCAARLVREQPGGCRPNAIADVPRREVDVLHRLGAPLCCCNLPATAAPQAPPPLTLRSLAPPGSSSAFGSLQQASSSTPGSLLQASPSTPGSLQQASSSTPGSLLQASSSTPGSLQSNTLKA